MRTEELLNIAAILFVIFVFTCAGLFINKIAQDKITCDKYMEYESERSWYDYVDETHFNCCYKEAQLMYDGSYHTITICKGFEK
jgi:hypothetical protein